MNNLFLFWEGPSFFLIEKLKDLIFQHSKEYNVHLVNYSNLDSYLDYIPKGFKNINLAFQADYVRVNTIKQYGGIWVDVDTLFMESPKKLFDILEEKTGFFVIADNKRISNGVFGSKKETALFDNWNDHNIRVIENAVSTNRQIVWGHLGFIFLNYVYNNSKNLLDDYSLLDGLSTIYPVPWENACNIYLSDVDYSTIQREFQPVIILVNSVYRAVEQNPNILNHSLLGKLIKMSEDNLL